MGHVGVDQAAGGEACPGLKRALTGLSLLLILLAMLGCSSGSGNSQSSSNSYTGHWSGTENLPAPHNGVGFQVQPNGTIFCFGFSDPNNSGGNLDTGCSSSSPGFPFTGNSFSLPLTTYPAGSTYGDGGTFSLTGQFTSLTQANGTVIVLDPAGTPITYTWTASLQ